MQAIHQFSFYLHVVIGSIALLIFWVPVFARKGSLDHKRFGKYFAMAMYTVAVSGFVMASLDLLAPLSTHTFARELSAQQAAQAAEEIRSVALFLLSLSILVLVSARQGWLAILDREDRVRMRQPLHLSLCVALAAVGVVLFGAGIYYERVLYMIFGALEVFLGLSMLHYSMKKTLLPKEWWTEHLGGLIGAGIGAYTAFFVFGGTQVLSRIFQNALEDVAIFLWTGPAVIGTIAIVMLTRHYRRRFSRPAVVQSSS